MEKTMLTSSSKYTYESVKAYDLNLFYKEDWSEEEGTTWSDNLWMQIYLYINDDQGSRTYEGPLFELDLAETRALAPDFPEDEYGTDFWIGVDAFLEQAKAVPESILIQLNNLVPASEVNPIGDPMVWYTKTS
jgi:hypothetical protein